MLSAERPDPAPRPLSEISAPHWLTQLLSTRKAPVNWGEPIRAAAALSVPIAAGTLAGNVAVGVEAALGALCGTLVARHGPYRFRLRHMGWGTLAGAAGFLTGAVAAGHGWWTSVVLVALAGISAVISIAGATASAAGLMVLAFAIIGAGQPPASGPYVATAWFIAGAGWTVLLAVAAWPVRATSPERAAIARAYDELAVMLGAQRWRQAAIARQRLTAALNDAYDALLTARSRLEGRDATYRRLFMLLSDTTPVVEAAVAAAKARRTTPPEEIDAVRAIADAIRADGPLPNLDHMHGSPLANALKDLRRDSGAGIAAAPRARPTQRARLTAWLADLVGGPATWRHTARLMLCIGLAELTSRQLHLERSYWVALTVALVLKPDFGSVFARAVLRAGGTVLGVGLGAAVLLVDPHGWALPMSCAILAAPLPIAKQRNYGLFSATMTPLVIVLVDLTQAGSPSLLAARLFDTALGCAIVVVFGYLCWPDSRRPRLGAQVAAAADTLSSYTARALTAHPAGHATPRRATYRELSDLRVAAQRLIPEPTRAGRAAAAWWPVIIGLERLADGITRAALETPPPPTEVTQTIDAIREIANAIRACHPPQDRPLPTSPALAAVATDIAAVRNALCGPQTKNLPPQARRRSPWSTLSESTPAALSSTGSSLAIGATNTNCYGPGCSQVKTPDSPTSST